MSDSIMQSKGRTALQKVTSLCTNLGNLQRAIQNIAPDLDVSSCAMTAAVLGDAISSNTPQAIQRPDSMQPAELVRRISELLDSPNAIFITTGPDHHFLVFPIGGDQVTILQGFQGVYNLVSWYQNKGANSVSKDQFIADLNDLVSGDQTRRLQGAESLFAYNSVQVQSEIRDYFAGDVRIKFVTYKAL